MTTLPPHLSFPAVETVCRMCLTFQEPVSKCMEVRCCWKYARHGLEQRLKDDARLAEEKKPDEPHTLKRGQPVDSG